MFGKDKRAMGATEVVEKPSPMTPEAAQLYVERGEFVQLPEGAVPAARSFECIDDRGGVNPDSFRYPGGGIGVAITVLATIDKLQYGKSERIEFQRIMDRVEHELGGMSFHSDTHSKGNPLPVAGCGHAKGALTMDAYGLGGYTEAMQGYADGLKHRRGQPGISEYVYSGEHRATSVIIINDQTRGQYLSLPGRAEGGQAFVVNDALNKRILTTLANNFYSAFASEFQTMGVSPARLTSQVLATYEGQLELTTSRLAKDLPVYIFDVLGGKPVLRNS